MKKFSTRYIAIASIRIAPPRKKPAMLVVAFLSFSLVLPFSAHGAQKRRQTTPKGKEVTTQRNIIVNDSNMLVHQRRVEDLVANGNFKYALQVLHKMNDYAKEVLSVATAVKIRYEEAAKDPLISQNEKELLFVKLKRLDRLIQRYTHYYQASMLSSFRENHIPVASIHSGQKPKRFFLNYISWKASSDVFEPTVPYLRTSSKPFCPGPSF